MFDGKPDTNSYVAWHRPQTTYSLKEEVLRQESARSLATATDPLEKLRLLCLTRGASGILGFGRNFRRLDLDDNNRLSMEEFFKGIKETGLAEEDAVDLFNGFDTDGSGSISVTEFIDHLRPPMSQSRRAIVQQAYKKLDKTGDGHVTIDDIRRAYSCNSHPSYMNGDETADFVWTRFLSHFELDGKCDEITVTLEDFMNYYSGISVSIDNDCYFDLMMRKAYKL